MPRTISSTLLKEMYRRQCSVHDGYSFSITGAGSHKYTTNTEAIGSYAPLAIKRTPIRLEEGTVMNELEIGLDNVDLAFRTFVMSGALEHKQVYMYKLFTSMTGTLIGSLTVFSGWIDAPKGDEHWVTVSVKPFPIMDREFPRRIYQTNCNWAFCDDNCDLTLSTYQVTTTLTAESDGGTLTCSHGQAADYFVPGFVEINSGDYEGASRPIYSNGTGDITMRVPFNHSIPNGTSIIIQKLCDKTPQTCEDVFSNYDRFGGFPHVPKQPLV